MELISLDSDRFHLEVMPAKGGDITSIIWTPIGIDLLWKSPWSPFRPGERATPPTMEDPAGSFLSVYPGGWQTIFPNGGDACEDQGVQHNFHGEASIVAWSIEDLRGSSITMSTRLSSVPFDLTRTIVVEDELIRVTETAMNRSSIDTEVMWSHHPAFGAPFLSHSLTVDLANANFVVDDERDVPAGLKPGHRSRWPHSIDNAGETVDLRSMPSEDQGIDRFGYITDLTDARVTLANDELGLEIVLSWDIDVFPHAWYWLEAHATQGYPWHGNAYVLAIEPASTIPGQGITNARKKHASLMRFAPDESKTIEILLAARSLR